MPGHSTLLGSAYLQCCWSAVVVEDRSDRASAQQALVRAWEQVGRDREQVERELRQRLDGLAAQLAVDAAFRDLNLVPARRRDADRLLRETRWFAEPRMLCTKLESRARRRRSHMR